MIKASELRIGNWVVDPTNEFEMQIDAIFTHSSMTPEITCLATMADNDSWPYEEKDLSPIPLTPEILEKAGFANNKGDFHFQNVVFLRQTGAYFIAKFYVDASSFASSLRRELIIRDVHQLQNLYYALTGEELQINL